MRHAQSKPSSDRMIQQSSADPAWRGRNGPEKKDCGTAGAYLWVADPDLTARFIASRERERFDAAYGETGGIAHGEEVGQLC